ncbi:MAG: hypothetical protein NTX17_07830 [Candidatus Eisenbacteria bacterium]|nr:hypothetical protein [Candidatus Eisenbacteria bacterium]
MDKYRDLYNLAKEIHAEEIRRFDLVSQKATWFLSVLSFLLGLAALFGKWLLTTLVPPRDGISSLLLLLGGVLLALLILAWIASFQVLRGVKLSKMPLNQEMLTFFVNNQDIDIHYALARNYEQGHRHNRRETDAQTKLLGKAHTFIVLAFVAFLVFSAAGGLYVWWHPSNPIK